MKSFVHFNVRLTWSKWVALLILATGFLLDLHGDKTGDIYRFAVPFVVLLITGNWVNDNIKNQLPEEFTTANPIGNFFLVQVKLTWSKMVAVVMIGFSVWLDVAWARVPADPERVISASNFTATLPWAVLLITGRQINEMWKYKKLPRQ